MFGRGWKTGQRVLWVGALFWPQNTISVDGTGRLPSLGEKALVRVKRSPYSSSRQYFVAEQFLLHFHSRFTHADR